MKRISISLLLLAVILGACAKAAPAVEPTAAEVAPTKASPPEPTHSDLAYIDDGDPRHALDVYLPDAVEGPLPTLFFIHGDGDTKEDHRAFAGAFTERGNVAVLIDYRSPNEPGRPLDIQDAFCALAWVHENAGEYSFDADNIVVFGFSVGGLIAANLGTIDDPNQFMQDCPHQLPESSWVRGVTTFAAVLGTPEICLNASWCMAGAASGNSIPLQEMVTIFEDLRDVPPSEWAGNPDMSSDVLSFAQSLPLYWVDGGEPPFVVIHGTDDALVPSGESEAFVAYLQSAGVKAELVLVSGAGHQSIYPASPSFPAIVDAGASLLVAP
jgi:acetyl esterase/lipase